MNTRLLYFRNCLSAITHSSMASDTSISSCHPIYFCICCNGPMRSVNPLLEIIWSNSIMIISSSLQKSFDTSKCLRADLNASDWVFCLYLDSKRSFSWLERLEHRNYCFKSIFDGFCFEITVILISFWAVEVTERETKPRGLLRSLAVSITSSLSEKSSSVLGIIGGRLGTCVFGRKSPFRMPMYN